MLTERKRKYRRLLAAVLLLMLSMPALTAYAGSGWRPEDTVIYDSVGGGDPSGRKAEEILRTFVEAGTTLMDTVLGALLSPFLISLADGLSGLLDVLGCSFDSVIFGRVADSSYMNGGVAMFTFELTKGNIYGTVAMFIYDILSGVFIIIILCTVLYRLTALMFAGYETKVMTRLKETAEKSVILVAAIFLMPKALDLALYIRDSILYVVASDVMGGLYEITGTEGTFILGDYFGNSGSHSILALYRKAAQGNLMNAFMYLGTAVLTLMYGMLYVSTALTLGILVVLFPALMAVDIATGSNRLSEWVQQVIGVMLVPVIDAVLLMFPITVAFLNRGNGSRYLFVELAMLMAVRPARDFIRQKLGFGSATGLERSGFETAVSAMRLAGAVALAASRIRGANARREAAAGAAEAEAGKALDIKNAAEEKGRETSERLTEKINERFRGITDRDPGTAGQLGFRHGGAELERQIRMEGGGIATANNVRRYREISGTRKRIDGSIAALRDVRKQNRRTIADHRETLTGLQEEQMRLRYDRDATPEQKASVESAIMGEKSCIDELMEKDRGIEAQIRDFEAMRGDADSALSCLESAGGTADLAELERNDRSIDLETYRTEPRALEKCSLEKKAELTAAYARAVRKEARIGKLTGAALGITGGMAGFALGASSAPGIGSPMVLSMGMGAGFRLGATATDAAAGLSFRESSAGYARTPGVVPVASHPADGCSGTIRTEEAELLEERLRQMAEGAARAGARLASDRGLGLTRTFGKLARAGRARAEASGGSYRYDLDAALLTGIDQALYAGNGYLEGLGIEEIRRMDTSKILEGMDHAVREGLEKSLSGDVGMRELHTDIGTEEKALSEFFRDCGDRLSAAASDYMARSVAEAVRSAEKGQKARRTECTETERREMRLILKRGTETKKDIFNRIAARIPDTMVKYSRIAYRQAGGYARTSREYARADANRKQELLTEHACNAFISQLERDPAFTGSLGETEDVINREEMLAYVRGLYKKSTEDYFSRYVANPGLSGPLEKYGNYHLDRRDLTDGAEVLRGPHDIITFI